MAEVFRYEFCTHVQAQSLPVCLKGGDVLAKAKTGTGKTLGFMIPVIEKVGAWPVGACLGRRWGGGREGSWHLGHKAKPGQLCWAPW